MTQEDQRLLLTPKEVMAQYGLNRDMVYALLRSGIMPSVDVSPKQGQQKRRKKHRPTYRIHRESLEKWLKGE